MVYFYSNILQELDQSLTGFSAMRRNMAAFYVEILERQMELTEAQESDWAATRELAVAIQDSLIATSLEISGYGVMVLQQLVSILYFAEPNFPID